MSLKALYICFAMVFGLATLSSCSENGNSSNAPASQQGSSNESKSETPAKDEQTLPDDQGEPNDELTMSPNEVSELLVELEKILPLGIYEGSLQNGQDCKITVSPMTSRGLDLQVGLEVPGSRDEQVHRLSFYLAPNLPLALIGADQTDIRVSLTTMEMVNGEAFLDVFSFKYDEVKNIQSMYIFNQDLTGYGPSNLVCYIDSYTEAQPDTVNF